MGTGYTNAAYQPPPCEYGRTAPVLRRIVSELKHLAQDSGLDTEDLLQEGFVALLGLLEDYDPRYHAEISEYAGPRLRDALLDTLRKARESRYDGGRWRPMKRYAGRHALDQRSTAIGLMGGSLQPSPEALLIVNERANLIRESLGGIGIHLRRAIVTFDLLETNLANGAGILGMTPRKAIRIRSDALAALRCSLRERGIRSVSDVMEA